MSPLFYEDSLGAKLVAIVSGRKARLTAENPYNIAPSDADLIDDPSLFADADRAARGIEPEEAYAGGARDWVVVFGPSKISGILDIAGFSAGMVTMPLAAACIEYVWSPYPPEEMPGTAYPFQHGADVPFTLLVAPHDAERARGLIDTVPGSNTLGGVVATHDRTPEAAARRQWGAMVLLFFLFGLGLLTGLLSMLFVALESLLNR